MLKFTNRSKINGMPQIALRLEVYFKGFVTKYKVKNAIKIYQNNISQTNYEDIYVYIAPHFRPERTTIPDSGYFQDLELSLIHI